MKTLAALRSAQETSYASLLALITRKFPRATIWHWYRALHSVNDLDYIGRRNDDPTDDVALAADVEIKGAHDEYIRLLHIFYRARDGERGVLGGRGL